MKDFLLLIVSVVVSMNMIYSVNELSRISENLIYVERCVLMQQSENDADDVLLDEIEMSDEELTIILGL